MIKTGIIGASGYTGGELVRLFFRHPSFKVVWATSRQHDGTPMGEVYPYLRDFTDLVLTAPDLERLPDGLEAVVVALPHTEAMAVVPALLEKNLKVVDLSADFRLDDPGVYAEWYGRSHGASSLLAEAVYGLPERYRAGIAGARLVANPGCYPTAAILALAPLLERGLIDGGELIVDAKSGVSGAGRTPKRATLFTEVNEGLNAYSVGRHRHTPEIEQELGKAGDAAVQVTFAPHLVPLSRGLLATIYVKLSAGATAADVEEGLRSAYTDEPFVKIAPAGSLPGIQEVAGTNLCRIGFTEDRRPGRMVLVSVIDNLVKGAAGQAVQNLNVMFGLAETTGLEGPGLFP